MARVLITEDNTAVREFVRRALAHNGHEVATASDGLDAIDVLKDQDFGLLVTDIVMPGMDGIALALKVAKKMLDMAILLMTGYAAERQRSHYLDELIHRVIAKPLTLREICNAIPEVLEAHHTVH
jgi:two-component system cell cycle response regulator CpdR